MAQSSLWLVEVTFGGKICVCPKHRQGVLYICYHMSITICHSHWSRVMVRHHHYFRHCLTQHHAYVECMSHYPQMGIIHALRLMLNYCTCGCHVSILMNIFTVRPVHDCKLRSWLPATEQQNHVILFGTAWILLWVQPCVHIFKTASDSAICNFHSASHKLCCRTKGHS